MSFLLGLYLCQNNDFNTYIQDVATSVGQLLNFDLVINLLINNLSIDY